KELLLSGSAYPHLTLLSVNAIHFCNAGSSIVQELGFALAMGAEYLNRLTDLGLDAAFVAPKMRFNFGIGGNYFMELAKLRAARMLWANLVKAYLPAGEVSDEVTRLYIHCETSTWNKTIYDSYVNMLRTQTEAMSAVLGGADSLTVLPFDSTFETPTAFAERIARNQQSLLKEEVHLDKVADPAAGSYYIESLTASIAAEAWKLFLNVQEKGGFLAAFRAGFVQSQVSDMAAKRSNAIASRRENVLGVNQFPNFHEVIESDLSEALFQTMDDTAEGAEVETLKRFRGAQALESLRYATDRFAAVNGRPKVMMLPIGNLAMRKARAQFSCNFFAAAGYEVIDHNGFETVEEGLERLLADKPSLIVLCSSDEEYAQFGPEFFRGLAGKAIPVIAGAPACMDDLKAAGIEHFIHVRTNLLQTLAAFNKLLGIA
ncbi:MAG: methylmalonyl-CoA mutase family protein, partial [Marinilabiliales bacterium]|nr:methylmalonyl-CoA mutase family protein [Marinilabiliales bacterium]